MTTSFFTRRPIRSPMTLYRIRKRERRGIDNRSCGEGGREQSVPALVVSTPAFEGGAGLPLGWTDTPRKSFVQRGFDLHAKEFCSCRPAVPAVCGWYVAARPEQTSFGGGGKMFHS